MGYFRILPIAILLCILNPALADLYLHSPPGSNDRNRERNENRNNANRLFNSQNNAKGGYPWKGDPTIANDSDPVHYFEESKLRVEWTVQHGCGSNPNIHCQFIIQYACEDYLPGVRDGYPSGPLASNDNEFDYYKATFQVNNADGTNRIPENEEGAAEWEYGMHENYEYYQKCSLYSRNYGLYHADRPINGRDARYTRQNQNANRHGFECSEEREYYPYWRETPWTDVAVLVSDEAWCPYYTSTSQNNNPVYQCEMEEEDRLACTNQKIPVHQIECELCQGRWVAVEAKGVPAPDCIVHQFSRDNHLGNAGSDETTPNTAHYDWTIPTVSENENMTCVLRVRYNMSSADYEAMSALDADPGTDYKYDCRTSESTATLENAPDPPEEGFISYPMGCYDVPLNEAEPRRERAYVDFMSENRDEHGDSIRLGLATNTNQIGRTFQDRSHVFKIAKRPGDLQGKSIWNVGVRGRRGNIVQTYPATEYDFTPSEIKVKTSEYLHFHFHGSDFNPARNPNNGEGWRYSDRYNLVQVDNLNTQVPIHGGSAENFTNSLATFWNSHEEMIQFAFQGTENLTACNNDYIFGSANNNNEQNDPYNCGKLNSAPNTWEPVLSMKGREGSYNFVSTRNNNFSNRGQKSTIEVEDDSDDNTAVYVGVGVGAGAVGVAGAGGFMFMRSRGASIPGAQAV